MLPLSLDFFELGVMPAELERDHIQIIGTYHDDAFVRAEVGDEACERGGLALGGCDGEEAPWGWLPITSIAGKIVEQADQRRRQWRIPLKRWPPWM